MKILMRTTAAGPKGNFMSGRAYLVPQQISEAEAKAWVAAGAAGVVPEEAKAAASAEKPVKKADYVPAPEPEAEKEKSGKIANRK